MSESSSDTESSCGWTIISNEGSDIETLSSENPQEFGPGALERAPVMETDLQSLAASLSAGCVEDGADAHEDTLKEETLDETFTASETGTEQVTLFSSSDHSDIMTLADAREDERTTGTEPEETAFYLGTSSSSQYTFTTSVETVFPMQQQQQPAVVNNNNNNISSSSSSEDETAGSSSTPVVVLRRRRLRKSTVSSVTEPDEDEEPYEEEEEEEEVLVKPEELRSSFQSQQEQMEEEPWAPQRPPQGHRVSSRTLNRCILLALVVATSMGFGHFYATFQIQERHKIVEQIRENEREDVRDELLSSLQRRFVGKEVVEDLREDVDELDMVHTLSGLVESITTENQELNVKHSLLKAQRDELLSQLKRSSERTAAMEREQQELMEEKLLLQSSLQGLREEMRALRAQLAHLQARSAGSADTILLENQRLKGEVEEERSQREAVEAESQTLRTELDHERRTTQQLEEQLRVGAEEEADAETLGELRSLLSESERKLSFERQRSDLWERLYVEGKEERAKGDTQPKVKKAKEGMMGKVKETFDAVKNSTQEFVHHHKEQIKKAKDAVKENLRKFSDSVKSTFRHFKDSASTFMNEARGSDKRFNQKASGGGESWQHNKPPRPHHRPPPPHRASHHHPHNTRKPGGDATDHQRAEGCSGVLDCAYQESMGLFNQAMGPVRADEFHQLLQSYLQQEVDHFRHWGELEKFVNGFFRNGVFVHDQMLFMDFVSGVEEYLEDMSEYHGLEREVFQDLDTYVYKHFFGDSSSKQYGPSRPFEGPEPGGKEEDPRRKQQGCNKRQRAARTTRQHRDGRKWSRSGRNTDRHMADVKIELGPMPFDPKY